MTEKPSLNRRQFVAISSVVASSLAASLLSGQGLYLRLYARLAAEPAHSFSKGELSARGLATLLLGAEAILDESLTHPHYQNYFTWRAEHLPGFRTLYENIAAWIESRVMEMAGCSLDRCDPDTQHDMMRTLAQDAVIAEGRAARLMTRLLTPMPELFVLYYVRPVKQIYLDTSAWLRLGYAAWPGTPRGLEDYTQPLVDRTRPGV